MNWVGDRFNTSRALLVTLAVVASACSGGTAESDDTADADPTSQEAGLTVVLNAEVYTVDPARPWADAFAYDGDGVIIAVGTEQEVLAAAESTRAAPDSNSGSDLDSDGANVVTIDAEGGMIVPGFHDPHVHVPEAGINAGLCFLPPGLSLAEYEGLATDCAADQPDDAWVRAAGPSLFELRESHGSDLPIDVLDRAIPDRPALILDDLGHAVWTNSLGLEAAGIGSDDKNPQGGVFHRDPATGRLTGLLLEDAQQLVRNAAALDDEANYQGLLTALNELAANGVTSVSDAGGYWAQNHPAAWQRAEDEGTLTVRASNSLYVYPGLDIDEQLAAFEERFDQNAEEDTDGDTEEDTDGDSGLLRFDTAKIYVDGILDLGTAALLDPYDVPVDPLYPSGFRYFQPDQLTRYVSALHEMGYRVSFHAIGDAAVREALDAVEAIDDTADAIADRRHRTTHTYMVHPDDVIRFAEIGVVADFQQSADAVDPLYHEFQAGFIGDRALELLPTARLLDAEASVTLSSDWDAGPLPPLGTIQRSLTRETNAVPDLETALAMATIEGAYALGHDDRTGSLTVGKQADFVMLDRNLFEIDGNRIEESEVLATYLAGVQVY